MLAKGSENAVAGIDRRRICVVTETYPPEVNGVALTLGNLVEGLVARSHEISAIRPRQRRLDCGTHSGTLSLTLVRGRPLPGYKGLQFGLPAHNLLQRAWTRDRPDVVYVATEGPLGWSAVKIAQNLRIPICSGFHTNYHNYSRHYKVSCLQSLILRYLRMFHNRTSATIVATASLRDSLRNMGFHNVECIGRGVDSQLFSPRRRCSELRRAWGLTEIDVAAVYVGRLAGEKMSA